MCIVSNRSFDSVDNDYKSQYDGYKGKFDHSFKRGIANYCSSKNTKIENYEFKTYEFL